MKKAIYFLWITTLLTSGCLCRKSAPVSPAVTNAPVQTVEAVATQPESPATPAEKTATSAAAQSAVMPTAAPQKVQPAVSTPKPAPEKKAVVLPPAPDKAVFKAEPVFPLRERMLGPLAALTPRSDAQVPSPWKGEQLKYGLYYTFAKVGTAYIKNRGVVDIDGQTAHVLQTTAYSASVIDAVFKVRDVNISWFDAKNLRSLGYSQSQREGNYQRDEWITFDYAQNAYQGQLAKKSGKRDLAGQITKPILDILTALYFVRTQDLSQNKNVVFDIFNREEQYPLIVKFVKRETVKTPAGKFKCIVVEPQFRGEGIFVSKGKSLLVWLTDDERKMPVKMKAEVFIGSVTGELLEYKRN